MTEETNSILKRQRPEEESREVEEDTKRQKPSYKEILTILDDDEDFSPSISAVHREISSSDESPAVNEQTQAEFDPSLLMRHLLEASDDELGIPSTAAAGDSGEAVAAATAEDAGAGDWIGGGFGGGDGLWEIDDEAANYYALLQSELFM